MFSIAKTTKYTVNEFLRISWFVFVNLNIIFKIGIIFFSTTPIKIINTGITLKHGCNSSRI